jgi:hypothetical protein
MATEFSPEVLNSLEKFNQETVKIEPVNSGLVKNPDQQDANYWNIARDMALSAPQGVFNAIEEQGDFIDENIISLGGLEFTKEQALLLVSPQAVVDLEKQKKENSKLRFQDFIPTFVPPSKWKSEEYSKKRQLPTFHKPETLAGNMTEGISRFLTGYAGPAKFLKGAGLAGTSLKGTSRALVGGAVADLTVFDPNEGRLSDMLIEFDSPVLNNAVTQYLATDKNDGEMEGRLKNVLEGFGLGGITESIFYGIKGFKQMKKTKDLDKRADLQKRTDQIIKDAQKGKKTKRLRKLALEDNDAINTKEALKVITKSKETAKKDAELWIKKILNTKSLTSGEQVLRTIDNIVDNGFDDITKEFLENDVLANDVALELAEIAGRDQKEVLKAITKEGVRSKDATVRMLTNKMFLQQLGQDYIDISKKYLDEFGENVDNWSKESKEEMALRGKVIQETTYALKEQIRSAARVTQAGRIKVTRSGGKILEVEDIAKNIKNFNANPAVLAKKIKDMKPKDAIDEISKTKSQKFIEVFNSLYINSLLSGTYTHAVNFLSNSYELLLKPAEQIAGGIVTANVRSIRTGASQYFGMMFTIGDTFNAVRIAFKQGDAVLDPLARTQDNLRIINGKAVRPISGSNLGFDGRAGTWIDRLGLISELPTRLLMSSDELFKQLNYRGRLFANAIDNTLELGLDVSSKEGKANIDRIFKEGFDKNGMANVKDNPIAAESLQQARVATFTNSLEDGRLLNIGGSWQKFLRNSPYLRFLTPFVRTPTNLWRQFETRIPVYGSFTKPMRDLWRTGDRRARAEVLGRQVFGISAALYAFHLTQSSVKDKNGNIYPKITGNGPKDFNIKKTWMNNGWQPYSIAEVKDDGTITYKQYNRMDPRFYLFGIAADINENNLSINDEDKENMFAVMALSAMRSAINKSYVRGLSDAFELAQRTTPENLEKYIGRQFANAIPYQALIGQGIPGITEYDSDMLEARSFVDEIIKKTPLITKTDYLEPRRDILTGEPIVRNPNAVYFNPEGAISFLSFTQGPILVGKESQLKDDPVVLEIARLKVPLSEPRKIIDKVELLDYKIDGQSAYGYWTERVGKTKIRGLTLKEKLATTFESLSYKRQQDGNLDFDGNKKRIIQRIFEVYKKQAFGDVLEKYEQLNEDLLNAKKEKYGFLQPMRLGDVKEQPKELLPRQ